jgi:hypothetical protein
MNLQGMTLNRRTGSGSDLADTQDFTAISSRANEQRDIQSHKS